MVARGGAACGQYRLIAHNRRTGRHDEDKSEFEIEMERHQVNIQALASTANEMVADGKGLLAICRFVILGHSERRTNSVNPMRSSTKR